MRICINYDDISSADNKEDFVLLGENTTSKMVRKNGTIYKFLTNKGFVPEEIAQMGLKIRLAQKQIIIDWDTIEEGHTIV